MKNMMTSLTRAFEARLLEGALPGELEGFGEAERTEAADFVAETAEVRAAETPKIALTTSQVLNLDIVLEDALGTLITSAPAGSTVSKRVPSASAPETTLSVMVTL